MLYILFSQLHDWHYCHRVLTNVIAVQIKLNWYNIVSILMKYDYKLDYGVN
jgi:hypothetical protein